MSKAQPVESVVDRPEWLELFFDLVVVAAIAVLAHGISDRFDPEGFGVFLILYAGVWYAWLTVVMYADVAGGQTRFRTVTLAMFGVAVMAASNPLHEPERANAFAIAFVLIRLMVARGSLATGKLLTTWTGLQSSGAIVVWVASCWVPTPAKYYVWGAAVVADLVLSLVRRGFDADDLEEIKQRHQERQRRRAHESNPRSNSRRENDHRSRSTELSIAELDGEHLRERLGLFYIIVLGEVVSRIVLTAAEVPWTRAFIGLVIPAFVVVGLLWRETFGTGGGGSPADEEKAALVPPRVTLPLQLVSTLGVVVMAAGFGLALEEADEHFSAPAQALMGGGLALHLLAGLTIALLLGSPPRQLARTCVPIAVLGFLAISALVTDEPLLGGVAISWVLVGCLIWTQLPVPGTSAGVES